MSVSRQHGNTALIDECRASRSFLRSERGLAAPLDHAPALSPIPCSGCVSLNNLYIFHVVSRYSLTRVAKALRLDIFPYTGQADHEAARN